jgi:hypothetical protein
MYVSIARDAARASVGFNRIRSAQALAECLLDAHCSPRCNGSGMEDAVTLAPDLADEAPLSVRV